MRRPRVKIAVAHPWLGGGENRKARATTIEPDSAAKAVVRTAVAYGLVATAAKLWSSEPARATKETVMEFVTTVKERPAEDVACVPISCDDDIVSARQRARSYALALGFSSPDATLVATAISELARNIVQHARHGEIALQTIDRDGRCGVLAIARDSGPGMSDSARQAMEGPRSDGTARLGLRAVKRFMDDVQVLSIAGEGTTVRVTRWKPFVA